MLIDIDVSEKDYEEVKKMNLQLIDQAFFARKISANVKRLLYEVWNNEPIITKEKEIKVAMTLKQYIQLQQLMPEVSEDIQNGLFFKQKQH
tara:strand:- start:520 stop:792 length:273 start_codon:yes stop_codon:yes gene_type:complete